MDKELIIVATVVSLTLLVFVVVFLLLLISNANRKNRHRADMADIRMQMIQEVNLAEREATQSAMSEIARELHDNLGQVLTAAQLGFLHRFDDELSEDAQLVSISNALDEAIHEVGRLGRSLNTDLWEERTLFESICESAAHVERLGLGIVHVKQSGEPDLNPNEKVILFRAFQEVLNNAIKHAEARTIDIELQAMPFLISIKDDGNGFDYNKANLGSGLKNIQKRCAMVQVQSELVSSEGAGCQWIFKKSFPHD